ncbi:MAG: glycosyltransferase [Candidatus Omnitrophica bacterium]|jgi:glycosyltransferase involved in cell wall biosynthesis|nr:glycosyltransferase [Candidatus Omnitrophota bacterium]
MDSGIPVVSISCLTYNHEKYIAQALDGFVSQETTFPFECIIHDDASSDRTPEIIKEYAAKYPDIIRAIFQTENQFAKTGLYPDVEHILPICRGKYIAICDGDDYWTDSRKLQKQVDFMERNRDLSMCYHDYRVKTGVNFMDLMSETPSYTADQLIALSSRKFWMASSTIMYRNYYNERTKRDFQNFRHHYMLCIHMGMFGGCKYLDGVSPSVYRKHEHNSWAGLSRDEIIVRTEAELARVMELMVEKDNPRWIELRKGVQ